MTKLSDLPFHATPPQPAFEGRALERFVSAPRIAVLAYTRKDGASAQFPIWYDYVDGRFELLTAKGSPKAVALAREGRASLTIQDDMPPYRAVIVDGTVCIEDAPVDGGLSSRLAQRYFGRIGGREYEKMSREENLRTGLVKITITPTRVRGFDNTRLIGAPLRWFMWLREVAPLPRSWF